MVAGHQVIARLKYPKRHHQPSRIGVRIGAGLGRPIRRDTNPERFVHLPHRLTQPPPPSLLMPPPPPGSERISSLLRLGPLPCHLPLAPLLSLLLSFACRCRTPFPQYVKTPSPFDFPSSTSTSGSAQAAVATKISPPPPTSTDILGPPVPGYPAVSPWGARWAGRRGLDFKSVINGFFRSCSSVVCPPPRLHGNMPTCWVPMPCAPWRIPHPLPDLDVDDDVLPAADVVGEVAEGVGRVAVVGGHEPPVVGVLHVLPRDERLAGEQRAVRPLEALRAGGRMGNARVQWWEAGSERGGSADRLLKKMPKDMCDLRERKTRMRGIPVLEP